MAVHFSCCLFIFIVISIHIGESAVTHERGEEKDMTLNNWKNKLSQVLDTENQELAILHNLIEQGESDVREGDNNGEIDTSPKAINTLSNAQTAEHVSTVTDSVSYLCEQGIITKLEENSKRMDGIVVFLSDLKNVLTEAITTQDKQMRFKAEVVELREEIGFLRKEVQQLKQEQNLVTLNKDRDSLEHKIHNDETTIQWLKDSNKQLESQFNEMSKACNATALFHIKQSLDQQRKKTQTDLLVVQRQIEGIQLQQLKQDEQIVEANGDIVDVRSWQANMGQKFLDGQLNLSGDDKVANAVDVEEHFLTETLKEAANFSPRQGRHSKRLKAHLREIHRTTKLLAKDHYHMSKRLENLEKSQKVAQEMVTNMKMRDSGKSTPEMEKRLFGLEETMTQYTLSLQNMGGKINVVNELQESTTQLFSTLEDLETRYDEKFTEVHTNLARMEASVSGISNSNEDLKEQQTFQVGIIQNVKKELMKTQDHLQKNHFRLASLQTQMLKWSSQKCSIEDSESIQNIRISSLESLLHWVKNDVPHDI